MNMNGLKETKELAEFGDANAQNLLGTTYEYGLSGVTASSIRAVEWYRLAAKQGHAKAQYNLAVNYFFGDGVTKDKAKALTLYRLAAKQGHAAAQEKLKNLGETI